MTDEQKPLELSFAQVHDIIQVPSPSGRLVPVYVMSRCDHPEIAFYDEVSKSSYPNIASLKADVARGGRFHLAVRCVRHRWLEKLRDADVIELWPAIACRRECGRESKCGPGVMAWMCPDCTRAGKTL